MIDKSEPHKIPHPKKRAFLAAYAKQGSVTKAAKAAKCDRGSHYDWLEADEDYAKAFELAKDEAVEGLEDEARSRAFDGSDLLLIFLLKGLRPEKYRDRIEHSGNEPVRVVFSNDYFKNDAHARAAAALAAPTADPAGPSKVQGGGVRPTLGQNGNGSGGHD